MKRLFGLSLGVVCLAMGIVACDKEPKAAEAPKMTDGDFERAIAASINSDQALVPYNISVSAEVEKNTATLKGTVPTESARMRVVELAKSGRPNLVITDKIDVKPLEVERKDYTEDMAREARDKAKSSGESVGDNVDDAWIHTKIRTKFVGEGQLPGGGVNVDVKNNIVTLRGHVKTKEDRAKLEEIAKLTDGVKSVKNLLTIKPD